MLTKKSCLALVFLSSAHATAGSIHGVSTAPEGNAGFVSCDTRPNFNGSLFQCTDTIKNQILDQCYVVLHSTPLEHCTWQSCGSLSVVGKAPHVTKLISEKKGPIEAKFTTSTAGKPRITLQAEILSKTVEIVEYGVKSTLTEVPPQKCNVGESCLPETTSAHPRKYISVRQALDRSKQGILGDAWDVLATTPATIMNANPYIACAREGGSQTAKLVLDGERQTQNAFLRQLPPNLNAAAKRTACMELFNENKDYLSNGRYRCYVNGFEVWSQVAQRHSQSWNLDVDKDGKVLAETDARFITSHLLGQNDAKRSRIEDFRAVVNTVKTFLTPRAQAQEEAKLLAIANYIQLGREYQLLDIDRDGQVTAHSDGELIRRALSGSAFSGSSLVREVRAETSNRILFGRGFIVSPTSKLIPSGKTLDILSSEELSALSQRIRDNVHALLPAEGSATQASDDEGMGSSISLSQQFVEMKLVEAMSNGREKTLLTQSHKIPHTPTLLERRKILAKICHSLVLNSEAIYSKGTILCYGNSDEIWAFESPADDPEFSKDRPNATFEP